MVQLYADGKLIYAPLLDGHELLALKGTVGVNKGGTAEITMPPGHPAYDSFVSYRTIVTIYRRGKLKFRGRALYPAEDFECNRTITCEGERCFFRDAIVRPYLWQTDPATIFRELIAIYNSQVDDFKKFVCGEVDVEDPNDYIRLEGESAETVLEVLDKLVERTRGFVVFTTNEYGERVVHLRKRSGGKCAQRIVFGENLLDYSSTGENTDLATRIIPYGAKDETTGKRLTIESVNGGLDYIQDDAAIALRGTITATVEFDDVTEPEHLLAKARAELNTRKLIVTTLTLSAVDMSVLDRDIESYDAGDDVPVYSAPHGLDDYFSLTERSYDFLNPDGDMVTMGKELVTLTGAGVNDARNIRNQFVQTVSNFKADVTGTVKDDLTIAFASKVNTADAYMTNDGLLLQWGTLTIDAGVTTAHVTFTYPYDEAPSVLITPVHTEAAKALACVDGVTAAGMDVYVDTDTTKVNWFSVGKASIE